MWCVILSSLVCSVTRLSTRLGEELHKGHDSHLSVILDQIEQGGVHPVLSEDHVLPVTLHLDHVVTESVSSPACWGNSQIRWIAHITQHHLLLCGSYTSVAGSI